MAQKMHHKSNNGAIQDYGSYVFVKGTIDSSSDYEMETPLKKHKKNSYSHDLKKESCSSASSADYDVSDNGTADNQFRKNEKQYSSDYDSESSFSKPNASSSRIEEKYVVVSKRARYSNNATGLHKFPSFMKHMSISSSDEIESHNLKGPDRSFSSFLKSISFASKSDSESDDHQEKKISTHKKVKHSKNTFRQKRIKEELDDSDEAGNHLYNLKKQVTEASKCVCSSLNKSEGTSEDSVSALSVPSKDIEILLLNHPVTVTLHKYVSVRVLSGWVSMLGFVINSESSPVNVLSFKETGLLGLKTVQSEQLWKSKDCYETLMDKLKSFLSDGIARKVLQRCKGSTVIVVLQRCLFPSPVEFLQLYFPFVYKIKLEKEKFNFFGTDDVSNAILFDSESENVAAQLASAIRKAKCKSIPGPRILVYGDKGRGKSSLLRFLINKTLNEFEEVYYLDADPGQTEFTPPGVVSLTKVTKPIFGPPFTHQKKPLKMIFTGSVTAETSPPMYLKSVAQLMDFFLLSHSSETLFVNTMGWVKGIGAELLQAVIKSVSPTILIELADSSEPTTVNPQKQYMSKKVKYFKLDPVSHSGNMSTFKAPALRNFSVLSYIGKCKKNHLSTAFLNDLKPYGVCWDKIAIYIFGKKCPPYRIVEAINSSFVALCCVSESLILNSDIPRWQKTLKNDPDNECLGFGVVRAVDEASHLLYIVTPLKLSELQKVNAILKGNIILPPEVYLAQPINNTQLPFTDWSMRPRALSSKRVKKRHGRSIIRK